MLQLSYHQDIAMVLLVKTKARRTSKRHHRGPWWLFQDGTGCRVENVSIPLPGSVQHSHMATTTLPVPELGFFERSSKSRIFGSGVSRELWRFLGSRSEVQDRDYVGGFERVRL